MRFDPSEISYETEPALIGIAHILEIEEIMYLE